MAGLLRFIFLLALAALPVAAGAQSGKAYAPEDLRQLSIPDRVRVIEREYADQSDGRLIPDDQLEFYLDQVDSGWAFSQIKRDIATSLRGSAWQPPSSGWDQRNVTCSSADRRYTECQLPFRGPAVLTFQFSSAPCVEGRNWGQKPGLIWVDGGCRAQFGPGRGGNPPGLGNGRPPVAAGGVVCESKQGKRRRCPTGFRGPVRLAQQYSDRACVEGDTWDWTPGEVWVTRGCRALFVEGRGQSGGRPDYGQGGGYNVTCTSDDGRYRTCAWEQRQGVPRLIEQLSRERCVEGSSWGYERGALWVDRGCRARFGAR